MIQILRDMTHALFIMAMLNRYQSLNANKMKTVAPILRGPTKGIEDDYVDDDCPPGAGMHPNG